MNQEEKPRVCAHCLTSFTKERPLLAEFAVSESKSCSRTSGESYDDCIKRFLASAGDGVYLDETKEQWGIEEEQHFSIVRYYHAGCVEPAQNKRVEQHLEQACGKIESLLRLVGFDDATVKIVQPSERLVEALIQFAIEADSANRVKQIRCLQVASSLGNFVVYFASFDAPPVIDLAETGISGGEIFMRLLKGEYAISPEGEKALAFPEAIFLQGGLFLPHPISLDARNLLSLMIFRQKLYERQQAKT